MYGKQRSPKYTPERIAPPVIHEGIPSAEAIVAHTTPIVAAVPRAVPVRTEIRQFRRNVISKNVDGFIRCTV